MGAAAVGGRHMDKGKQREGAEGAGPAFRFAAFISYSHKDAAAVKKLHGRIETYRLPKGLRARHDLGDTGRTLGPVFRDQDDLSAASDLPAAIKQALDQSAALIVACSPSARQSQWVAQEIDYFRAQHPHRPVLAALLSGEPEDAFPQALTEGGTEPLAADLRAQGDGWKLGFLKIIAGMAQVPLDALIQRDSQRKLRRVMAVTGVSAVLAIIMAAMTTMAILSRNEAEFQRDQAEGLIAYLMDDLRTELKGVGRLDVMQGVNERALGYYSAQGALSSLKPGSLEQRAAILLAQGEDLERKGELKAARQKFQESYRDTQELLRRDPDNPDRIFSHAQSEFWVGFAAFGSDFSEVDQHWSQYLKLARNLQKIEPDTTRSLTELGFAHGNLCELRFALGARDQALEFCEQSIGFMERAVEASGRDPEAVINLANRHGWLADTLMQSGDFDAALAEREIEQAGLEELLDAKPKNARYRLRRTWAIIGKADIALSRDAAGDVPDILKDALSELARLNMADTANAEVAIVRLRAILLNAAAKREAGLDWRSDLQTARQLIEQYSESSFGPEMRSMIEGFENGETRK